MTALKQTRAGSATHSPSVAESPADIAERAFSESPYHAMRFLKCSFADGVLTISGRLPSYYLKQLAQSITLHIDQVRLVRNNVEVG